MRNRESNIGVFVLCVLLVLLAGSVAYNIYDNHRFIVVEQEISLDRLPASFDGFRILQISDLHARSYGEDQADLIKAINSIDYDMITFIGDMNDSTVMDHSEKNSKAILDLLDGITNKKYLFWIDGNTGPYAIESDRGANTGKLTEIGTVLQAKGCKILTLPYAVERGDDVIWITPEMSEIVFDAHYRSRWGDEARPEGQENDEQIRAFYQEAYASFLAINGNGQVKIMLTHTPKQINLSEDEIRLNGDLDYDLIIAGHYHGGQLRLPVIGALYIPSPTTGINNSGYFPASSAVKGLSLYGNVPQYVSAGLGASGHVQLVNFRLFNTPEINLITLKRRSVASIGP